MGVVPAESKGVWQVLLPVLRQKPTRGTLQMCPLQPALPLPCGAELSRTGPPGLEQADPMSLLLWLVQASLEESNRHFFS